jgi:7,8-dihydro-6-hydroxymethylpterin dimethyltransferase
VIIGRTTGLCGTCKRSLPAELVERDGAIYMTKTCDVHGPADVLISSSASWYHDAMSHAPRLQAPGERKPVSQGCPFDCGPCEGHEQRLHLPVLPITSSCNLDCPICYTHNKNDGAYHMSEDELRAILVHLRRMAPEKRIVNLTGGEPTMHPQFERIVDLCHEEGIHRITISTHGLRFLRDEPLLEKLARIGARVVLSFDSFTDEGNRAMLGGNHTAAKLRILELLEKHDVHTTLLPVLARGVNDHEIGKLLSLALGKDFIRSVEIHPMTFTGQSGRSFDRAARYTAYDALQDVERVSEGMLRVGDFVPLPSAHPLCYQVTYVLRLDDGTWLPFPRFMTRDDLRALLDQTIYMLPGPEMEERLQDVMNRLWSGEIPCDQRERVLGVLKGLVQAVFEPGLTDEERLAVSESRTKAIYVHTHMDEENFDSDRIRMCPVGMPTADGRNVPSCAYNVLYRERDPRFMEAPEEPLVTLGLGRVRAS